MRLSAHFWHLIWVSFSVAQRGWKTTDPRGRRGNHHRQEDRVLPRTICWGKTKEKHRNIWAVGLWGRKRNSKSGLDCRCRVIWGCDYSFYWEGFPHNEGDFYTCLHHTHTHTSSPLLPLPLPNPAVWLKECEFYGLLSKILTSEQIYFFSYI